uniref:Uncharacterized protein n=1 Tax=Anguilla anguilla TaxID=7936 RepID=A0A0E9P889_ANGAN
MAQTENGMNNCFFCLFFDSLLISRCNA